MEREICDEETIISEKTNKFGIINKIKEKEHGIFGGEKRKYYKLPIA